MKYFSALVLTLIFCSVLLTESQPNFGNHLRHLFTFEEGYINLNHGSFGSTPRYIQNKQNELREVAEGKPDFWFRETYRNMIQESRRLVSEYIQSNSTEDVVLVENASSAVNAVFRSLNLVKGDAVLIMNRAYPMVKNLLNYLVEQNGIQVVEVNIKFPVRSIDDFLIPVSTALVLHKNIKIASFSHIESTPGVVLPIYYLTRLCRSYISDIRIFVDGAHAIGQIPINLKELDVDYYTSNLHKWFYAPKGVAFLWVRKEYQSEVVPTVLGSEFTSNDFDKDFEYTGTRDYTGFAAIPDTFEFRNQFGDEYIMYYMKDLAWWVGNYLSNLWGTSLLYPESMCGSMIDIGLPVKSFQEGDALKNKIYEKYKTYFIVYELQGSVYTRLSTQIFLERSDFELFGQRVLDTLAEMRP